MRVASDILTSKTTWTAAIAILIALAAALTGEITWPACGAAVLAAIQSAWLRDTIARGYECVIANVIAEHSLARDRAADGRALLGDHIGETVGWLRDELALAVQMTAANADRVLTLAESVADQATVMTTQATRPAGSPTSEGRKRASNPDAAYGPTLLPGVQRGWHKRRPPTFAPPAEDIVTP